MLLVRLTMFAGKVDKVDEEVVNDKGTSKRGGRP